MTTATPSTAGSAFSKDPFYALGRADAHDEAATLGLDAVKVRANTLLDNITPDTSQAQRLYTAGYAWRTAELVEEHLAVTAAQAEVAQTWLARKQGRERSTLHTTRSR